MSTKPKLMDFSRNEYSQFGEDGIIEKILQIIGEGNKTCLEFGAWNGVYDSNTAKLWLEKGWMAILIEGEQKRFSVLQENTKNHDCICVQRYVEPSGENSIDQIIKQNNINDIDILSIDIDGNDYYILEKLVIRPRVIICEYNPTIPADLELVGKIDSRLGASAKALNKLAKTKGYELIAITDTNCFFVKSDLFFKFSEFEVDYKNIIITKHICSLMTDYDGNYFFSCKPAYGFNKPLTSNMINIADSGGECTNLSFQTKKSRFLNILKRIKNHKSVQRLLNPIASNRKKAAHAAKVSHILRQKEKYGCEIMIETGTYLGDTIQVTKENFKKIYSIELSCELFRKAKKRFSNSPNIFLFNGDSGKLLAEIIKKTNGSNVLFWLDGHYSGGITEKGESNTPIFKELNAIINSNCQNCVILIDDASDFNGLDGYPNLEQIKSLFKETQSTIEIINNIITITPKNYDK